MSAIAFALEKQRLQLAATAQRSELAGHARGLSPLFEAADQVRSGLCWTQRHPEVLAAGAAVVLAASPDARRFAWRWGRRVFLAWRFWRDSHRWLDQTPASVR